MVYIDHGRHSLCLPNILFARWPIATEASNLIS